jgi:hypothetical protein
LATSRLVYDESGRVQTVEITSVGNGLPIGTRLVVHDLTAAELPPILPERPARVDERRPMR